MDNATDDLVMQAFGYCLIAGINVIDMAVNYRYERAEQCLGWDPANQIDVGPYGGLPRWMICWVCGSHCIHPNYIDDRIERSHKNLGVETVDL